MISLYQFHMYQELYTLTLEVPWSTGLVISTELWLVQCLYVLATCEQFASVSLLNCDIDVSSSSNFKWIFKV